MLVIQTALSSLMGLTSYGKKSSGNSKSEQIVPSIWNGCCSNAQTGCTGSTGQNSSSIGSTAQTSLIV